MPAIWRTCIMFPRAPDLTIMSIGLDGSASRAVIIFWVTSEVAEFQISTSFWRRSPSVMMPRRNWASTFSASFSWRSRISTFSGGVLTSSMDTVRPDRLAYSKQTSFMASRHSATTILG